MQFRTLFLLLTIITLTGSASFAQPKGTPAKQNNPILAQNAAIDKAVADAVAAFKNRDDARAIAIYDAVIKAYPAYSGIPMILSSKANVQMQSGRDKYIAGVMNKDNAALAAGKQFFTDAVISSGQAVNRTRSKDLSAIYTTNTAARYLIFATHKDATRLVVIYVDPTELLDAVRAYNDYFAIEVNATKKQLALVELGDIYTKAGETAKAKIEYERALVLSPNDPTALYGLGSTLAVLGDGTTDKVMLQKAANLLKSYLNVAATNDAKRKLATELLDYLKSSYSIMPK